MFSFVSVLENAAADELAHDGVARDIRRIERRQAPHHVHQDGQAVLRNKRVVQIGRELWDLAQVFCQNAQLVIVERVDVDGGVGFVGRDILLFARVDGFGAEDRVLVRRKTCRHLLYKRHVMMKKAFILLALAVRMGSGANAKKEVKNLLSFDSSKGVERTLTMPTGQTVKYKAYEKLWYVTHVEDTTYQYMNVYVPDAMSSFFL